MQTTVYWLAPLAAAVAFFSVATAHAQDAPPLGSPPQFARGVVITIPPDFQSRDTVSTHDLVEIRANADLQWNPEYLAPSRTLYALAEDVKFRRDIWCLEFSFKPLRMIHVDVPQPNGQLDRRLVWYMVYRVRNTGQVMRPAETEDAVHETEFVTGGPIRFIPQFVFESHDRTPEGERVDIAYLDRVIPAALEPIRQREMRGSQLLTSTEIADIEIPVTDDRTDRGVWGVAMWEGIDPRVDFFSIYVGGLTNAYRWTDTPGAYQPGDPPGRGRHFQRKTLQLNFWRPGDERSTDERAIRFGVPLGMAHFYDVEPGVAHTWIYR